MKRRFVYIGTLDFHGYKKSYGIHTAQMDCSSGELLLVDSQDQGCNATFISMDSKGQYLYAVSERLDSGSAFTYQIEPKTYLPCYLGTLELPAAGCVHNTISKNDQFLLVSCWKTSNIISCHIGPDGLLTKVVDNFYVPPGHSVGVRQTQPTPHQLVFDHSGKYALVPDLGADRVYVISFDVCTGKLTLISTSHVDPGGGPRHLVFHQNNKWVYLFTELENEIYLFNFNEGTGELNRRQKVNLLPEEIVNLPNTPEIQGAEIQVSPDGRFVFASMRGYLTEEGHDRFFRLDINPENGELSNLVDFPTYGLCPRMFQFTSDCRFILVCNQSDNEVLSLSYDSLNGNIGEVCGRVMVKEASVLDIVDD